MLLSPVFGGQGTGVPDRPSEPTIPKNWLFSDTPRNPESPPRTDENKPIQQQVAPIPKLLENEGEGINDITDLQESINKSLATAFVDVTIRWLNRKPNPSLDPVIAELRVLRGEEEQEGTPLTPFAFSTALIILSTAFNEIDMPVPMPAIAPDGSGGIRIEWARGDRNVRAVIPSYANKRSFVYHIINDRSELDRLSGANLAARLRQVIL